MAVRDIVQAAAGVGGAKNYIEDVFSTYLYTGNGSTQTINNGIDLAGEGGLVWLKSRSAANWNDLYDTARGRGSVIYSNSTSAANSPLSTAGLTSFNSNGFSLGVDYNGENPASTTQVSWTFRKQPKFFDVVTYTGNGVAGRTVAHNLGSVPRCIIVKRTDTTGSWPVYHVGLTNANWFCELNTTAAQTGNATVFTTNPTTSVFSVGTNVNVNASGGTYVAYLFAHNAGGFGESGEENVISCGSIFALGGANDINLGFEAQFILLKKSNGIDDWYIYDTMRGMPVNNSGAPALEPNLSAAEANQLSVWPTATGFATNGLSGTYIYIAIRRGPMKVPESGTSVFAPQSTQGPSSGSVSAINPSFTSNFPADMLITGYKPGGSTAFPQLTDRLRGGTVMSITSDTASETSNNFKFDSQIGVWYPGQSANSDVNAWMFRRAPGFFDEVCYTGDGTVNRSIPHNLGVIPEFYITKARSGSGITIFKWGVYSSFTGLTKVMQLSLTNAAVTDNWWGTNPLTATSFSVSGNDPASNNSTGSYVAYLFASAPGVSKVFNYTGNGSSQTINCGFTGGARFVLIKRTDSTGDWYVWDSARGIVAGNDPHLSLNTTVAEVTTDDSVDTDSTGFIVNQLAATNINVSSATYIGLAIA